MTIISSSRSTLIALLSSQKHQHLTRMWLINNVFIFDLWSSRYLLSDYIQITTVQHYKKLIYAELSALSDDIARRWALHRVHNSGRQLGSLRYVFASRGLC